MNSAMMINVDYKEAYDATAEVLYDLIADGQCGPFEMDLLGAFVKPDAFVRSLRQGHTMMHLGAYMEEIEKCVKEKLPFIIVVWREDRIWVAVNGEEVQY